MGKKEKVKEKSLIMIFFICLIIALSSLLFLVYKISTTTSKSSKDNSPSVFSLLKGSEDKGAKNVEAEKITTTIKISAIGDCTLGSVDNAKGETFNYIYNKQKDNKYFFSGVIKELENDNLTIANLEGTLSNSKEKVKDKIAFKGNPNYTQILKAGSIESVNLANDHTDDYGYEGLKETKQVLKSEGIKYFGYNDKLITEVKGIKIGILGYKEPSDAKNTVEYDIKSIKKEVDLVIISFHWGENKSIIPSEKQKKLGRQAIDSGADLVIGHHPQVIQGIETYKDKKIVYSLGNFISAYKKPSDKDSFIYKQEFTFDSNKKLISSSKEKKIPISISSNKKKNDYKPTILEGSEKDRVNKKIEERSNLIEENYNKKLK